MNSIVEKKQLRQFALLMAFMVLLLFAFLLPWIYSWTFSWTPYVIAGGVASVGLFAPVLLGPVYRAWIKMSHVIGVINSKILLFLVFFLVFTPMGLIAKLFGFDPMKKGSKKESYYVQRENNGNNMENPF